MSRFSWQQSLKFYSVLSFFAYIIINYEQKKHLKLYQYSSSDSILISFEQQYQMEAGKTQKGYVYTEKELSLYQSCPELLFVGGHTSGFVNCSYCANVFRCYRRLQKEDHVPFETNDVEEGGNQQSNEKEEEPQTLKPKSLDENGECTKLMCMKAGWCMCQ